MNASLLEQTQCKKFLYAIEISPKVQSLKAAISDLQTWTVESLDEMLQGESKKYAYEAAYEQARWDPVLVLHSSGSTGKIELSRPPKKLSTPIHGFRTAKTCGNESCHMGSG